MSEHMRGGPIFRVIEEPRGKFPLQTQNFDGEFAKTEKARSGRSDPAAYNFIFEAKRLGDPSETSSLSIARGRGDKRQVAITTVFGTAGACVKLPPASILNKPLTLTSH